MTALLLSDLLSATGGTALQTVAQAFAGASIDSRTITPGDLFFALRAQRDGHEFLQAAVQAGAAGVVVETNRPVPPGVTAVAVASPREALGQFGQFVRRKVNPRIAGVTGSSGKTTTKDLLAAALGDHTLRTEGNLNNDLGVPLTLLRLSPEHRYAVIEMGMSARGEIAALAELASPEVGIVTLVAPAHLEHLGSEDEIARAKGELFSHLAPGGTAIFPDDDPRLEKEARAATKQLTFGQTGRADVRLLEAKPRGAEGADVTLSLLGERLVFHLPLVGTHNARNAAAAAAAAHVLGRTPTEIARGLARARPPKHRSEIVAVAGRSVLADLYNANPASMRAALETVAALRRGRDEQGGSSEASAFAVLGDMLELGPTSPELHRALGARVAELGYSGLIGVGKLARAIVDGALEAGLAPERVFLTTEKFAAAVRLAQWTHPGDWIVIKGSRGMRMEEVLDGLKEELG